MRKIMALSSWHSRLPDKLSSFLLAFLTEMFGSRKQISHVQLLERLQQSFKGSKYISVCIRWILNAPLEGTCLEYTLGGGHSNGEISSGTPSREKHNGPDPFTNH
jgi:hypothetical protein